MNNIKLIFVTILLVIATALAAQSVPQKFKYQGVAKFNGQVVTGTISLQISIRQNAHDGEIIYQEQHTLDTNGDGVFAAEVGTGLIVEGVFPTIDWASGIYFIQVELDPTGGNTFESLGFSQLVSVPYALHAATVEDKDDDDPNPTNELQYLTFDESTNELRISEGNSITLPLNATDDQILTLEGTTLTIEGGNTVELGVLQDGTTDADADPENELQTLSRNGDTITLSGNGGFFVDSVNDGDFDTTNEIQTLSLDGPVISISGGNFIDVSPILSLPDFDNQELFLNGTTLTIEGGNSVELNVLQDGTEDADADAENELQTLSRNGDTVTLSNNGGSFIDHVNDGDFDTTNELQTLSLSGPVISISNGNQIDLTPIIPLPGTDDQQLLLDNTLLTIEGGNTVDLAPIIPPPGTDDQQLTLDGTALTIEGGNTVDLSALQDGTTDADADPQNELQTLSRNGDTVTLSGGGGSFVDSVNDADFDTTNELQTLTFLTNSQQLSISGTNNVDLSSLKSPWDENTGTNTVTYNGTARAPVITTTLGAVLIDDTGISRYDPVTGRNVSNICLETIGNTVFGKFEVLNNENLAATYHSCIHGSGILDCYGPNGDFNTTLGHFNNYPNHGLMGVVDGNNFLLAGAYVDEFGDGVVFGDIKNFRITHPNDPSKEIWYASLEGPEAAAYERGTAQLVNGEAFVPFSEHFAAVITAEKMTVMLSPLSSDTYGLAVIEKKADGFVVKELANGSGNFEFDWEAKAVRKGYENYNAVRDKQVLTSLHK